MCELLALTAPVPFPLGQALRWAEELEHHGDAGHGWGICWLPVAGGPLQLRKQAGPLRGDPLAAAVGSEYAVSALVHMRMPTDMSTVGLADTQPFMDAQGTLAFAHNGYLAQHQEWREAYAADLAGRADSEVGWAHFRALVPALGLQHALRRTFAEVGGPKGFANLLVLEQSGALHAYCANTTNRVCRLQLAGCSGFATTLHKGDAAGLQALFPDADLELLPVGASSSLSMVVTT